MISAITVIVEERQFEATNFVLCPPLIHGFGE